MRIRTWVAAVVVASSLPLAAADEPRQLSFEERVEAQAAIDRVYYRHQTGATRPFDEVVPREVLERKVRAYLDQTAALESFWNKPVTPEMLQAEIDRMTRESRMPERLLELFGALDNDPFLIAECLARPALVSRLAGRYFSNDDRIHETARREIERLRSDLLEGKIEPENNDGSWRITEFVTTEDAGGGSNDGLDVARAVVTREELARRKGAVTGGVGPVIEDRTGFGLIVAETGDTDRLQLSTYTIPKTDWRSWREATDRGSDAGEDGAPPSTGTDFVLPPVQAGTVCQDEGWVGGMYVPQARQLHVAVWTGSRMLVWGGRCSDSDIGNGARYDPATDTWEGISTFNEPEGRSYATAVWTGTRMLVWGGVTLSIPNEYQRSGGMYNPATDTWEPITPADSPLARSWHTAVWTGTRMIVWGGAGANGSAGPHYNDGASFDPVDNFWYPMTTAQAPTGRRNHTAVWTGTEMIVWGGYVFGQSGLDTGGKYDPATGTWTSTTVLDHDLPTGRREHKAVWTGDEMIVWGGRASGATVLASGGLYDPAQNSWRGMSTDGGAQPTDIHQAIWTGTDMIIGPGKKYDPATDTWTNLAFENSPYPVSGATAVWTGTEMIVWGGDTSDCLNSGARYDELADSWTPVDPSTIKARDEHTAIWTGARMVVWGGDVLIGDAGGGQYDPSTNTWTPVSLIDAPENGSGHSGVWTGDFALYFGGFATPQIGRYDPLADTWETMSSAGGPSHRWDHTGVWTGSEMIIWGGIRNGTEYNDGGRYNLSSDSWTPTAVTGAPGPREVHTAVWTGTEMIVWGGAFNFSPLGNGGTYDPATDTWGAPPALGSPAGRRWHSAVWSGEEMIVWGGISLQGREYTGGRYHRGNHTWQATSLTGAPVASSWHTAVWSGEEMIVWGGYSDQGLANSGGRYDPLTDSWTATPLENAPVGRLDHTALWIGDRMIVWGGADDTHPLSGRHDSGGQLAFELTVDNDGDGFSDCDGDCNDLDPEIFPFQTEVCDGFDNDCDSVIDEDAEPGEIGNLVFLSQFAFSWDAGTTGPGGIHDVARGVIGEFPVGSGAAESCVQSTTSSATFDIQPPPAGTGYWYLVRARDDCGAGTYGNTSDGTERVTGACP